MLTRQKDGERKIIGRRNGRQRETTEYAGFARRMLKAYGRRVANADEVDLAEMIAIRNEMDDVIALAVHGQRTTWGRSWAYIAEGAGITRQAAQQRWGKAVAEIEGRLDQERNEARR